MRLASRAFYLTLCEGTMQRPSPSRRHLCRASGEPKAKPGALLFATTLPSDRPGNPERFSLPLAKYRSAQKGNIGQSKKLQRGRQLDPSRRSIESQEFDAALRHKIVGQEEGIRALMAQRGVELLRFNAAS